MASCNAYFRALAAATPESTLGSVLRDEGFLVPSPLSSDAAIGTDGALAVRPAALLRAYLRLTREPWAAGRGGCAPSCSRACARTRCAVPRAASGDTAFGPRPEPSPRSTAARSAPRGSRSRSTTRAGSSSASFRTGPAGTPRAPSERRSSARPPVRGRGRAQEIPRTELPGPGPRDVGGTRQRRALRGPASASRGRPEPRRPSPSDLARIPGRGGGHEPPARRSALRRSLAALSARSPLPPRRGRRAFVQRRTGRHPAPPRGHVRAGVRGGGGECRAAGRARRPSRWRWARPFCASSRTGPVTARPTSAIRPTARGSSGAGRRSRGARPPSPSCSSGPRPTETDAAPMDPATWEAMARGAREPGPRQWTSHCGGRPLSAHAVWGNDDQRVWACARHPGPSAPWSRLWTRRRTSARPSEAACARWR